MEVLTIEQAAELLKVSKMTVWRKANDGEIPGRKVGNRWRFRRDVLESWLAGVPLSAKEEAL